MCNRVGIVLSSAFRSGCDRQGYSETHRHFLWRAASVGWCGEQHTSPTFSAQTVLPNPGTVCQLFFDSAPPHPASRSRAGSLLGVCIDKRESRTEQSIDREIRHIRIRLQTQLGSSCVPPSK